MKQIQSCSYKNEVMEGILKILKKHGGTRQLLCVPSGAGEIREFDEAFRNSFLIITEYIQELFWMLMLP